MLFGTVTLWLALISLLVAIGAYLTAGGKNISIDGGVKWTRIGRASFTVAAVSVLAAAVTLGAFFLTHRFDVKYVYEHTAKAMAPLYWLPSLWAGQEGSFLLWAVWISVIGLVLARTAGVSERRVMPVFSSALLFLMVLLVVRSPFLPNEIVPTPAEGLGLNPNLENPWMAIHPPTTFLGFAALAVPFAFALQALFWRDWDGWLRRALPWGLFGFSVLGLAMIMGGYWAYEMLGWGGFWGWDPVENGPLVPWLGLVAFLHAAQIQRVRGGFGRWTLGFALLPFVMALYETFITRSGVLADASVHSFSTLGGVGNALLLGGLIGALLVSVGALAWRARQIGRTDAALDAPASREFGYVAAIVVLSLCALIASVGMSAPLLTSLGQKLHLTTHVASVKEDFYNKAMFPIGVLLLIGMGTGPFLAWRGSGALDAKRLTTAYALSVISAILFIVASRKMGVALSGPMLAAQLILFTAAMFALFSNAMLLRRLLPSHPGAKLTIGGALSHLGVAVFLLGVVCLVTFTRQDKDVALPENVKKTVLDGAYSVTYVGQTSDYKTDKNNALRFAVASKDGREKFEARLPFAERMTEGGQKMIFGHPAIVHHAGGDLYFALKDGPVGYIKPPIYPMKIALGGTEKVGPFQVQFEKFERDPAAAAFVQQTGQMPAKFPVYALLNVTTLDGKTTQVRPQFVMARDNPGQPQTVEAKLPGGWLVAFQNMNAGSADKDNPNAAASTEQGSFLVRPDSGPPVEGFILDVSTRPMINLVWVGTLMLVFGGLISMRRRLLENRLSPVPDLPEPEATPARRVAKGRGRKPGKVTTRHAPAAITQK